MRNARIPSLNWLRVFEAAARYQSFARAAETLNMSVPAVSQQVRALEGHLGRDLFIRGPQWVRLTEAGHTFLPTVSDAMNQVEVASRALFGNPGGQIVTLQVSLLFGCSWLAPRLLDFERQHPEVQLNLISNIRDEDGRNRAVDLSISFGMPPSPNEEGHWLFGETLYPVARPEIASRISGAEDLLGETLLEVATHRANWQTVLAAAGVEETGQYRVHYADTTPLSLAIAGFGQGVALARAPVSDSLESRFGLVPCLPGFTVPGLQGYHLNYPALGKLRPAAGAFRDWVLRQAEGTSAEIVFLDACQLPKEVLSKKPVEESLNPES